MIEFKNIKKIIDGKTVIDDISGLFEDNTVNMIIGPSGTGKSVLMKCLLGLTPIDDGEIYFNKNKMEYGDNSNLDFKKKIGVLFQKPSLLPNKTIEENVKIPLDLVTDYSNEEKIAMTNYYLEKVGLSGCNKKFPYEISGGMQKRAGLAQALVHQPKYLFCDEPNSGLDTVNARKIDKLIHEISKKHGMTTVIVSHDLDSMTKIEDKIIFIYASKKMWEGNAKDILSSNKVELNKFLRSSEMFEKYKQAIEKK